MIGKISFWLAGFPSPNKSQSFPHVVDVKTFYVLTLFGKVDCTSLISHSKTVFDYTGELFENKQMLRKQKCLPDFLTCI